MPETSETAGSPSQMQPSRQERPRPLRVLLAGGGTAGHVNPLLATAAALRDPALGGDPDTQILVLGTAWFPRPASSWPWFPGSPCLDAPAGTCCVCRTGWEKRSAQPPRPSRP